jgi:hypothetical protein
MYAIGVPAFALQAIKAVVVIVVILLYSEQVKGFVRGLGARRKRCLAMMQRCKQLFSNNRRFIPITATALLA